jgi:hypothetical protein
MPRTTAMAAMGVQYRCEDRGELHGSRSVGVDLRVGSCRVRVSSEQIFARIANAVESARVPDVDEDQHIPRAGPQLVQQTAQLFARLIHQIEGAHNLRAEHSTAQVTHTPSQYIAMQAPAVQDVCVRVRMRTILWGCGPAVSDSCLTAIVRRTCTRSIFASSPISRSAWSATSP